MSDDSDLGELLRSKLQFLFARSDSAVIEGKVTKRAARLGELEQDVTALANIQHNGRGVVLTLCAYKLVQPDQDIRSHKKEHVNGFNARGWDTDVTCPFLREKGLPAAAETHWLTQIFSGEAFLEARPLRTTPRAVGILVPRIVCAIESRPELASAAAELILCCLIEERNRGRVVLTKPRGLSIEEVTERLRLHFETSYSRGAPRLPQLAIYAAYQCLIGQLQRYQGAMLRPIERLKAANRKSGSVADIDVERGGKPVEAIEIKMGEPISAEHVRQAIEKIRGHSVDRYYVLSTSGIEATEESEIRRLTAAFRASNGCEIITNGVLETLAYYLRLLGSTNDFIDTYVGLLADDEDIGFEHRERWNAIAPRL